MALGLGLELIEDKVIGSDDLNSARAQLEPRFQTPLRVVGGNEQEGIINDDSDCFPGGRNGLGDPETTLIRCSYKKAQETAVLLCRYTVCMVNVRTVSS